MPNQASPTNDIRRCWLFCGRQMLVFIVLYGLYGFKWVTDPKFGLIEDWSYGEVYQYIKEFWIMLLMVRLFFSAPRIDVSCVGARLHLSAC